MGVWVAVFLAGGLLQSDVTVVIVTDGADPARKAEIFIQTTTVPVELIPNMDRRFTEDDGTHNAGKLDPKYGKLLVIAVLGNKRATREITVTNGAFPTKIPLKLRAPIR